MRRLRRLNEPVRHLLGGVALALCGESLRLLYLWGRDIDAVSHFGWATLVGLCIGCIYGAAALTLTRHPVLSARLRRLSPWSKLAPLFKKSTKFGIQPLYIVVGLCYAVFYLNEGLTGDRAWADWINRNVFHFRLLGQEYGAQDILPFYILGFAILIVARWLFRKRCPRMLIGSHQAAPPERDPTATPYEFADTIEQAGLDIPARDLYNTLNHLAERNELVIARKAGDIASIEERLQAMYRAVEGDRRLLIVGHAAEFARHLPEELGRDIYVTGRALFDIIRWRARLFILSFTVFSAVLVSLPTLYHIVWVVFPTIERAH